MSAIRFLRLSLFCLLILSIGQATSGVTKCAYVHHDVVKMTVKSANRPIGGDPSYNAEDTSKGSASSSSSKTVLQGEVLPDNRTMQCTKSSDFCYALWKESPNNKSPIIILAQGCWESSGEYDCRRQTVCVADNRPMKAMNNTKFCCCSGDLCNANMTESDAPFVSEEPDTMQPAPTYQQGKRNADMLIMTLLSTMLVATGLIVVFLSYRRWTASRKRSPDAVHLMESTGHTAGSAHSPTLDLENLKLIELVGRGRYGSVWRGTLNNYEVAVKVFVHQHRQYFLNERDIYTLPCMEHPSLMKFIGGEQKPTMMSDVADVRPEYYLIMGYAPFGCLQDYLRANVVDWPTLCCMTQGVANGLAHLHTDLRRGDKVKLCISHRDVNSRNVLVKADLSCALCDMGFAMKIAGSKYYSHSGEEQHAETTSLTDVGTLRYMAPEVLEGAVNLRDCESSLKQIDVYALGLVTWEVAIRCSDLYQGLDVPDYKLPFEVEIGLHPTFEQMQVLVSRNKARPLFPEVWKDTNLAVRLLKETIEDCWDQDAEARLTSLCVEERFQELPTLWERHKANNGITGVSPTINPTFPMSMNRQLDASSSGELADGNSNIMGVTFLADTAHVAGLLANRAVNLDTNYEHSIVSTNPESSMSDNTFETVVTMSPTESIVVTEFGQQQQPPQSKNSTNNQVFPWLPMSLQPHQGRNPCLERNMIMEPLEEVSISGNTLLGKGSSQKNVPITHRDPSNNGGSDIGDLFDGLHLVDNMESNSLLNHDVLSQSNRAYHPIPYLQNAVHNALPIIHYPKQTNVPGNGQHPPQHQISQPVGIKSGRGTLTARFERKKGIHGLPEAGAGGGPGAKLNKERSGIRSLLDWSRLGRSMGNGGQDINDDASTKKRVAKSTIRSGVVTQRAMSDSTLNKEKSNLVTERSELLEILPNLYYKNMVQTEVCTASHKGLRSLEVDNRKTIVRLTNTSIPNGVGSPSISTELGIAKLHIKNGQAPVIKMRSGSHTDLNIISTPSFENDHKQMKRPSTLKLNGHNFHQHSNGSSLVIVIESRTSPNVNLNEKLILRKPEVTIDELKPGTKKIEQDIKNPFGLNLGRLSLNDDRMMSSWPTSGCLTSNKSRSKHCYSAPIDVNYLYSPIASASVSSGHSPTIQQQLPGASISSNDYGKHVETSLSSNLIEPSNITAVTTSTAAAAAMMWAPPSSINKLNSCTTFSTSAVNGCSSRNVNGHSPVFPPPVGEPVSNPVSCT